MQSIVAIIPCSDLDASERFYGRLGFRRRSEDLSGPSDYRILYDAEGSSLHLRQAEPGWLVPGRNPFGLYCTHENVDRLAADFAAADAPAAGGRTS